jgi:hypothetical protein
VPADSCFLFFCFFLFFFCFFLGFIHFTCLWACFSPFWPTYWILPYFVFLLVFHFCTCNLMEKKKDPLHLHSAHASFFCEVFSSHHFFFFFFFFGHYVHIFHFSFFLFFAFLFSFATIFANPTKIYFLLLINILSSRLIIRHYFTIDAKMQ